MVVRLLLELQTGMLALPLPSAFFFMMRCLLMPERQLEGGGGIITQGNGLEDAEARDQ